VSRHCHRPAACPRPSSLTPAATAMLHKMAPTARSVMITRLIGYAPRFDDKDYAICRRSIRHFRYVVYCRAKCKALHTPFFARFFAFTDTS